MAGLSTDFILKKEGEESVLDYAIRISDIASRSIPLEKRKVRAQFFTPKEVSNFMADMFTIKDKREIRLLDPGAGVGNLTAAFCNKILSSKCKHSIEVDAYENDLELVPFLKNVLEMCKKELEDQGHAMTYVIHKEDFVLHNERHFMNFENCGSYDYVISNPPYYKLDKTSSQAVLMRKLISAHPNIYALFMVLSAKMLKPEGELVFITPRSFCSGMYYKNFRKWFLQTVRISHIHTFESRRDIFADEVLQENILIKAVKSDKTQSSVKITSSKSKIFDTLNEMIVEKDDMFFRKNGYTFIRIPSSCDDVKILRLVDAWPNTLNELGLEVSTGPVVVFRTRENVNYSIERAEKEVPLIWMHNFHDMEIKWPAIRRNKPNSIYVNEDTKSLLLPVKNYVLLKRFSSKEQRKRLYASVLLREKFPFETIGIENHVNYIHKINGEMSKEEAVGVAALLNSRFIDNYFRSLNGNTQVNAIEMRSLPLPHISKIVEIGKTVLKTQGHADLNQITCSVLQIGDMNLICQGVVK